MYSDSYLPVTNIQGSIILKLLMKNFHRHVFKMTLWLIVVCHENKIQKVSVHISICTVNFSQIDFPSHDYVLSNIEQWNLHETLQHWKGFKVLLRVTFEEWKSWNIYIRTLCNFANFWGQYCYWNMMYTTD